MLFLASFFKITKICNLELKSTRRCVLIIYLIWCFNVYQGLKSRDYIYANYDLLFDIVKERNIIFFLYIETYVLAKI